MHSNTHSQVPRADNKRSYLPNGPVPRWPTHFMRSYSMPWQLFDEYLVSAPSQHRNDELHISTYYITMYVCVYMCVFSCFFLTPFVVFSSAIATYSNQHCPQFTTWSYAFSQSHQHSTAASWGTTGKLPLSQGYRYRCLHGKYLLLPVAAHHGPSITAIHGKYWGTIFCHLIQCCHGLLTITHCTAVHHSTSTSP